MKTFTEMAEEWIRVNLPATPVREMPAVDTPDTDAFDPLDELRGPFVEWFNARIWLDAEAVAKRWPDPRWCAGIASLYADLCAWMFDRGLVPPVLAEFRHLLEELCCEIRTVHGEELVSNIALKEDVEAQKAWKVDLGENQNEKTVSEDRPRLIHDFFHQEF